MSNRARLVEFSIRQVGDGSPGFKVENAFGQTIQVLPRPPRFRASVTLEWEGAMPDEVIELASRANSAGIEPDRGG